MKKFNSILCAIAAVAAVVACDPEEKGKKDETPAELLSFSFLKADNANLDADYAVETISSEMILRLSETNDSLVLVATLTAGENDDIMVNEEKVDESGKISVAVGKAIDIVVTNSKSGLSSLYVVKVGKILKYCLSPLVEEFSQVDESLGTDVYMAINPSTKAPWLSYPSTPAGRKKNVTVLEWNGQSLFSVGTTYITPADETAVAAASPALIAFDSKANAYVAYKGGDVSNLLSMRKFDGVSWNLVGKAGFSNKFSMSYGACGIWFNNDNPAFVYMSNIGKTDANYRSAEMATFNGKDWTLTASPFPSLPKYGYDTANANAGMFYVEKSVMVGSKAYIVVSSNLLGYYVYKVEGGQISCIVENFKPAGEDYGIPTCLDILADADGKVYVMAGLSKAAKYQLYSLNESNKTLELYGSPIVATAGSSGSIAEALAVAINPVDNVFYAMFEGENDSQILMYLNPQLQWETVKTYSATDIPANYGGEWQFKFNADGVGYVAYISRNADKQNKLNLYSVGLEEDILPE